MVVVSGVAEGYRVYGAKLISQTFINTCDERSFPIPSTTLLLEPSIAIRYSSDFFPIFPPIAIRFSVASMTCVRWPVVAATCK